MLFLAPVTPASMLMKVSLLAPSRLAIVAGVMRCSQVFRYWSSFLWFFGHVDPSGQTKRYLQEAHTVAPDDTSAINVFNTLEEVKRFFNLITGIKLFFWFVGICTIIAGVVGVSNIMLIVVKERTREIGVRKALGAKPWSIVGMILHEAIFVTAISGFAGLIFSMALLEIFGPYIEVDYILNPSVNFNVAVSTVFVLIFAGAVAGFFPAWRAANIHVIDALRDE